MLLYLIDLAKVLRDGSISKVGKVQKFKFLTEVFSKKMSKAA
jgi:hypothetical protein